LTAQRVAVGAAVAVAAVVFLMLLVAEPAPDPIRPGQPAPAFELPLLDGGNISLESLRGRVVLLTFWATWCKPCEAEMPAMERLYKTLAGDDFELVAVSTDAGREEVVQFQHKMNLTFPIALDPGKRFSNEYQSYRFPESYLIDREGKILSRYIGPRDWDSPVYVDRIRRVIGGAGAEAVRE
jgi:peroxiredoxin